MSSQTLETSRSGMLAAGDHLVAVADNIANLNTVAFKRTGIDFQDIFYTTLGLAGATSASAPLMISYGFGAETSSTTIDFAQGPLLQGIALDAAILGTGFFRVTDSSGAIFYTRYGIFEPKGGGAAGRINIQVGDQAYFLDPPIVLPEGGGEVHIQPDGVVTKDNVPVGQITLARFVNPEGLISLGDSLFQESLNSGRPITGLPGEAGFGVLQEGFLEGANSDLVTELVETLEASRAFELNAEAFQAGNEELGIVIALVRAV